MTPIGVGEQIRSRMGQKRPRFTQNDGTLDGMGLGVNGLFSLIQHSISNLGSPSNPGRGVLEP